MQGIIYSAEALADNISIKRFGRCPSLERLSNWWMQMAWISSWDENERSKYIVQVGYFDLQKNKITEERAREEDFYYKRIRIIENEKGKQTDIQSSSSNSN